MEFSQISANISRNSTNVGRINQKQYEELMKIHKSNCKSKLQEQKSKSKSKNADFFHLVNTKLVDTPTSPTESELEYTEFEVTFEHELWFPFIGNLWHPFDKHTLELENTLIRTLKKASTLTLGLLIEIEAVLIPGSALWIWLRSNTMREGSTSIIKFEVERNKSLTVGYSCVYGSINEFSFFQKEEVPKVYCDEELRLFASITDNGDNEVKLNVGDGLNCIETKCVNFIPSFENWPLIVGATGSVVRLEKLSSKEVRRRKFDENQNKVITCCVLL